jgi:hypothetical protein
MLFIASSIFHVGDDGHTLAAIGLDGKSSRNKTGIESERRLWEVGRTGEYLKGTGKVEDVDVLEEEYGNVVCIVRATGNAFLRFGIFITEVLSSNNFVREREARHFR